MKNMKMKSNFGVSHFLKSYFRDFSQKTLVFQQFLRRQKLFLACFWAVSSKTTLRRNQPFQENNPQKCRFGFFRRNCSYLTTTTSSNSGFSSFFPPYEDLPGSIPSHFITHLPDVAFKGPATVQRTQILNNPVDSEIYKRVVFYQIELYLTSETSAQHYIDAEFDCGSFGEIFRFL